MHSANNNVKCDPNSKTMNVAKIRTGNTLTDITSLVSQTLEALSVTLHSVCVWRVLK